MAVINAFSSSAHVAGLIVSCWFRVFIAAALIFIVTLMLLPRMGKDYPVILLSGGIPLPFYSSFFVQR
jgi:hypothetical protein